MNRIMFVCHGNICRSPCAEFVMKKLVKEAGTEKDFLIRSSATSTEEIGNPVYPPMQKELAAHGISCKGKYAVQLRRSDYGEYDLFLVMDDWNLLNIRSIFHDDSERKIHKLLSFAGSDADISDPWYTRDFSAAYNDIYKGCRALFDELSKR